MKKIAFMLVAALSLSLGLALIGCAQSSGSSSANKDDDSANQGRVEIVTEEIGKTVIDNERCAVEVLDKFAVANTGGYHLKLTNRTDDKLLIRLGNETLTVGGEQAAGHFSEELLAGASADTTLAIPFGEDETAVADKLKNVRFTVETVSPSNVGEVITYDVAL